MKLNSAPKKNDKSVKWVFILILVLSASAVFQSPRVSMAQNYKLKTLTPDAKDILDRRRDRNSAVLNLKNNQMVGENNHGYLTLLKDDSDAERIVEAENRDRKLLYQIIARQNNAPEALPIVEKVFAEVQREQAAVGHRIQHPDGTWSVKQSGVSEN